MEEKKYQESVMTYVSVSEWFPSECLTIQDWRHKIMILSRRFFLFLLWWRDRNRFLRTGRPKDWVLNLKITWRLGPNLWYLFLFHHVLALELCSCAPAQDGKEEIGPVLYQIPAVNLLTGALLRKERRTLPQSTG
jgi:hypothetical protein